MLRYKQTHEYAYDLLEHFYNINILFVESHAQNEIEIHVPVEIFNLLACRDMRTGDIVYPYKFKGIDLVPTKSSSIEYVEKQM